MVDLQLLARRSSSLDPDLEPEEVYKILFEPSFPSPSRQLQEQESWLDDPEDLGDFVKEAYLAWKERLSKSKKKQDKTILKNFLQYHEWLITPLERFEYENEQE